MSNRYSVPSNKSRYSVNDVIKNLFDLLAFRYKHYELAYLPLEERDVVKGLFYKGTGSNDVQLKLP